MRMILIICSDSALKHSLAGLPKMKISTFATTLSLGALSMFALSATAIAEDTVYSRYAARAERIATDAEAAVSAGADAVAKLQASNNKLTAQGVVIMKMYGEKFTECAAQYADFEAKLPQLAAMSTEEIELKYHDGDDLPLAPGHCYFGRALVVHPAMNAARLTDGALTSEELPSFQHESLEVAGHVRRVEKRINQP